MGGLEHTMHITDAGEDSYGRIRRQETVASTWGIWDTEGGMQKSFEHQLCSLSLIQTLLSLIQILFITFTCLDVYF